ncbi:hypothetical protein PAXRUDRAFT_832006 [Paxillus rubicundulus Ve08.2h10]|uniref:Uncharacterized protein n=1 Tax=Paxillus rubicundulus Ve08.2h10 TaxID=930991 RepID=A0A0D0DU64_9AGAM|nr:hypothetical protein PAXRUDRAFT_832006 [Paxillus rubicundulus Ve08.2h10]
MAQPGVLVDYGPVDFLRGRANDPYRRGSLYLEGSLSELHRMEKLQETSQRNMREEINLVQTWYDQQHTQQARLHAAAIIIRWYQIRKKIKLAQRRKEFHDENLKLYESARRVSSTLSRSLLPPLQRVSGTSGQDTSPNEITQGIASVEDNGVSETETTTQDHATLQEFGSSDYPVRHPRALTTEVIEQGPATRPHDAEIATDPVETLSSVRRGVSPTSPTSAVGTNYFISCVNYHNYNANVYNANPITAGLAVNNDRSNNDNSIQNNVPA